MVEKVKPFPEPTAKEPAAKAAAVKKVTTKKPAVTEPTRRSVRVAGSSRATRYELQQNAEAASWPAAPTSSAPLYAVLQRKPHDFGASGSLRLQASSPEIGLLQLSLDGGVGIK